jgi:hypothetical protein
MCLDLRHRLARASVLLVLLLLAPALCQATDYSIYGRQAMTIDEPGGFVGLSTTAGVNYMGPDPLVPTGGNVFSYAAVYDTGASGCVAAAYMAQGRGLPTIAGATYQDVGIGGTETFSVSIPTRVKMASVGIGGANSETLSYFSSYGDYSFQVRQSDPKINVYGFLDPVYINVVGTPVLNKYVMYVKPGGATFPYYVDGGIDLGAGFTINACPVNYLETNLLASAPSFLGAGSSQLVLVRSGDGAILHVPLSYQNFVSTSPPPPVSTSTNPMIPGVSLTSNGAVQTSNWLFDTGAAVTMIGRNMATALNLFSQPVVATTTVLGVGGDLRTINGYEVDNLTVPMTNGDKLVFQDIVVFVPGVGDLPAELPGIFGMNLLNSSFSGIDQESGNFTNLTTSAFSEWYVVPAFQHPGDANGDGAVNGEDLNTVLSNYNQTGKQWAGGDFNGDGLVNGVDYDIVLSNYNQGASVTAAPEPSGLALLAVSCLLLVALRAAKKRRS